jgi:titin
MVFNIPVTVPLGAFPGSYECWIGATDKFANGERFTLATFDVFRTPAGQPSSPTSLRFDASTPTDGILSWLPPETLGDPAMVGYVLEYSVDGLSWQALPKSGTKVTSIDLSELKADTDYWFRVRGENGGTVGQDTSFMKLMWATLQVRTPKPIVADAPTGLLVSDVTSNSYKLAWTKPSSSGGSAITDFNVEVSSDSGKSWKSAKQIVSTSSSIVVTGAAPGTQYLVRVSAINGVGQSAFLTGSLTTLVAKPSSPRTLTSSKVTATALTLSWLLPASNGGAAITDYKVEVSSNGGTSWAVINDGVSNSLAATVSSLLKNRAYLFRVSAINSAGAGDTTPSYSVTTLATAPSTPISLTVRDLQATSVLLGWDAPSDFGGLNLTDYKVETSRDGKTWSVVPKTASTSRTLKLTGLAPGTQYLVRVSALNVAGSSEHLTGTLTTLATTPSVPRNIVVTAISTNAATLNWQLPSSNGGSAISDYTVEIASNCTTYSLLNDGVSNTLYVKLSSLKPGLTYCVRVSAVNSVGTSETTPELQVKTLDYKPSAPKELAVKTTSTSVVLSWGSASVGAGSSVIDYVVEFSSNGGGTWIAIKKTKSSKTSLTVSGLKSKRTYLFRVLAVNLAGTSPASKTLKVTTK